MHSQKQMGFVKKKKYSPFVKKKIWVNSCGILLTMKSFYLLVFIACNSFLLWKRQYCCNWSIVYSNQYTSRPNNNKLSQRNVGGRFKVLFTRMFNLTLNIKSVRFKKEECKAHQINLFRIFFFSLALKQKLWRILEKCLQYWLSSKSCLLFKNYLHFHL